MGFFTWWKSNPAPKKTVEGHLQSVDSRKAVQEQSARTQDASAAALPVAAASDASTESGLLASPYASEKASALEARGTYVFTVPISATKVQIRTAVEKEKRVQVARVNMMRGDGKPVRRGRQNGRRPRWKRAFVTLKPGHRLELHKAI